MEPPARRRAAARKHGAPWDQYTCGYAALGGHLEVLQWSRLLAGERLLASAARHGTRASVHLRLKAAISLYCNGYATMAHHGTSKHARRRLEAAISRCCSGCVAMTRRGISGRAGLPVARHCWNGRVQTARPNISVREFICSNKNFIDFSRARMSLLALPLDVQRLLFNHYLCDEDALVARCACRVLFVLVPRARIDACRYHLYAHFCVQGYTSLLVWLHKQVPLRESHEGMLCSKAAAGGHLATLQWLRANHAPWHQTECSDAARRGHITLLQWLRTNGAPWSEWICTQAAEGGHLTTLQWLRAHGAPWDEWTCARAAEGGHLTTLQWLRAHGAPWHEWTCIKAAKGGHLAVLQWAREHGAPWDERTCAYAAGGGHLTVLQWLHANGAPWDEQTCRWAAYGGHSAVLQWAREHGAP